MESPFVEMLISWLNTVFLSAVFQSSTWGKLKRPLIGWQSTSKNQLHIKCYHTLSWSKKLNNSDFKILSYHGKKWIGTNIKVSCLSRRTCLGQTKHVELNSTQEALGDLKGLLPCTESWLGDWSVSLGDMQTSSEVGNKWRSGITAENHVLVIRPQESQESHDSSKCGYSHSQWGKKPLSQAACPRLSLSPAQWLVAGETDHPRPARAKGGPSKITKTVVSHRQRKSSSHY